MNKLSERVKNLRKENKLSQGALAKKIKSSQKIIDYWEKGVSEPKANFIVALADCFGCTADYILGREDDFGRVNINSDLADNEKFLIEVYRGASAADKQTINEFIKFIYSRRDNGTN